MNSSADWKRFSGRMAIAFSIAAASLREMCGLRLRTGVSSTLSMARASPSSGMTPVSGGVQRGAQRVDVGARVGAGCTVLLGRGIAGGHGARARGGGLAALDQFCQTEVHQEDVPFRRDAHVAGLEIAVNDGGLAGVQVLQGVAHGRPDPDRLPPRRRLPWRSMRWRRSSPSM